jgi:hypothetical protein
VGISCQAFQLEAFGLNVSVLYLLELGAALAKMRICCDDQIDTTVPQIALSHAARALPAALDFHATLQPGGRTQQSFALLSLPDLARSLAGVPV